jgi:hypothetical protein
VPGYRQPGVTCVIANTLPPIDGGTGALTASPTPSTVGAPSKQQLSEHDLSFIQTTAGRTIGGASIPLQALQHSRAVHLQQQEAAERQFGPGSWAAQFEQATVDCLDALIEEAQSPYGKATEEVRVLTEALKNSGSEEAEHQLTKALEVLFGIERQRQLLGVSDESSNPMPLVADALNAAAERRNKVLKSLIEKATRSPASVSDDKLRKAMTDVLGVERQRQLLGVSVTEFDGAESMALVNEAAKLRGIDKGTFCE